MLKLAYFDDDLSMLELFRENLSRDFHIVTERIATNYSAVLAKGPFDAIVIDIDMPVLDGIQLHDKILAHPDYNGCPVIFLTNDDSDNTVLFALKQGAEDVIHRKWSPEIMAERIRQKVNRYFKEYIFQLGDLRLDKKRYKVTLENNNIELSLTEFKLLNCLMSVHPEVVGFSEVFQTVWSQEMDEKNLHTHLSNLRKKLKGWAYTFKTVSGKKIGIIGL